MNFFTSATQAKVTGRAADFPLGRRTSRQVGVDLSQA